MKSIKNRKGFTMVELVVTFALLALFIVAMTYIINASTNIYGKTSERATAQMVSETLMEKVAGEISGAQGGVKASNTLLVSNGETKTGFLNYANGKCIALNNRTGSPLYITTKKGSDEHDYLLIHYRPVNDNSLHYDAVDWTFDKSFYEDFWIKSLDFQMVKDRTGAITNIVLVKLVITDGSVEYDAQRYVECYNFEGTMLEKVKEQAIPKDET